jgi:uncharacterized protein YyaL (SSP411 family)
VALLETVNRPPFQIIVRGEPETLAHWQTQILPRLRPKQTAYFISRDVKDLPDEITLKSSTTEITAWVCEGFSCRTPIHDLDSVLQLLDEEY